MKKPLNTVAIQRPDVKLTDVKHILAEVSEEWMAEISNKGPGIFASIHEIESVVREEADEVKDALHEKPGNRQKQMRKELLDVIVASLHGIASIDSGQMTW